MNITLVSLIYLERRMKAWANAPQRFAALCLFAPCTKFQVATNVDGANSTKPLL